MRSFYARVEHKVVLGVNIVNLLAVTSLILILRHRGKEFGGSKRNVDTEIFGVVPIGGSIVHPR